MTGLTHVRFIVDDFAPMLAFYRDALGFRVVLDIPGTYVELETGAARIGLVARAVMTAAISGVASAATDGTGSLPRARDIDMPGSPAEHAPGASADSDVVLQVQVADVDAASDWLRGRGLVLASSPHDQAAWLLRVAHVRDPAGHMVELATPIKA